MLERYLSYKYGQSINRNLKHNYDSDNMILAIIKLFAEIVSSIFAGVNFVVAMSSETAILNFFLGVCLLLMTFQLVRTKPNLIKV